MFWFENARFEIPIISRIVSTAVDTKNRQSDPEISNGIFQIESPTFVHKFKPIVCTVCYPAIWYNVLFIEQFLTLK